MSLQSVMEICNCVFLAFICYRLFCSSDRVGRWPFLEPGGINFRVLCVQQQVPTGRRFCSHGSFLLLCIWEVIWLCYQGNIFFFFGGNLQVLNSNLDGDFLIVFLVVKSDSMLYVYANYLVDINLTLSLTTCQIISMESSWLNMAIYCSYHPLLVH